MTKPIAKTAPAHLSEEARKWWQRIMRDYAIADPGGLLTLQTGLEAFDRLRSAQAQIAKDGQTVEDRFGQQKPHPLLAAERDARSQLLMSLRALNLDMEGGA